MQYVSYMFKKTVATSEAGSKKKSLDPLKKEVPILGPRFVPPNYLHIEKRSPSPKITPGVTYLKPLHVVHPFYYLNLKQCLQCDETEDVSWQGWAGTGYREVHGLRREETAIGYQLECGKCKDNKKQVSGEGVFCIASTSIKFWARRAHWEISSECNDLRGMT